MNTSKDLDYARREFEDRKMAFVMVKNGKVLAQSKEKGVAPFFSAVVRNKVDGASLADKIIGKAVASLCAYRGIAAVYTPVVSEPAVSVLEENQVSWQAEQVVPMIINRTGDGQCPIESAIVAATTPEEAYLILKRKFEGVE
ncbi:MAG: DUF1893 domain-containing protein [Theionarchaea archaeon]|nr:DUF1893 domain-containing protein [Theionarchaea archaeon]MBU7001395.1 DUF1893 domain-containing protein [Theionarchaea archaeon]MBU7021756.1 DUF1893 domain-containing protein [Theionarchaea archaeon]MBU7034502.1 DUF1893 domain-containing protein [Theionarchaea archaeon]MBU7040801.1 DUF1893 domain-containing protein [Theionarchaea archaeon]